MLLVIELDLDATKYKETEIENNSNNRIHLRKDNSDIEIVYMYINPNEVDEESPLLSMMVKYTLSISSDKKDNLKINGKNIQYYSNGLDKHVYVELMDDIHGYSVTSNNRLSDEELKELFNYKIKDYD